MLTTTMGQYMVNQALPEELRDYHRKLDGDGARALMQRVADEHPDKYRVILKRLADIGRNTAYQSGGYSFGLRSMQSTPAYRTFRQEIEQGIEQILDSEGTPEEKQHRILKLVGGRQKEMEDGIYKDTLADNNPLGLQVLSGSRGKAINLKSLRGGDGLYMDHKDNTIPIPVLSSYSQGLTPAEYFAGTFGARKGVIDVKMGVANSGFFGKQLKQAVHRLLVSQLDADPSNTVYQFRGLPADVSDAGNQGALLGQEVGGYKRNTLLTPRVLKNLEANGIKKILVRSPIVGGPADGGLYARDVGVRERGGLAPIGDEVGISSAEAIGEPISQSTLGSKHAGGVAGAAKSVSGFAYLNQMIQVPKAFPGGAAHSTVDGRIQSIENAPAGGKFVTIGETKHYVGAGFDPIAKVGDEVEAGDVISEGIPNPAKIVQYKGVGEGRRYFVHAFRQALKETGIPAERRHIELIARGLINHVRLTDEVGDHLTDDTIPYDQIEHSWQPREGFKKIAPKAAIGKYLETPVLHHSIGTKITPRMLGDFKDFNVNELDVHDDPPPFEPVMIRGMDNLQHDPDWMSRMLGSGLRKGLENSVHTGRISDSKGTSFVPALTDPANFGRQGLVRGYDPKTIRKPSEGVL